MLSDHVNLSLLELQVDFVHGEAEAACPVFRPSPGPSAGRARPREVSALAGKLAEILRRDDFSEDAVRRVAVARGAGVLVYAMELYGWSWPRLNDLAGHAVAETVARLSPDIRLTVPRAAVMLRSNLATAGPLPQAVRLAEVLASARDLYAALDADGYRRLAAPVKAWIDDREGWVDAMVDLRADKAMKPYVDRAYALLRQLADARELAVRPRRHQSAAEREREPAAA